MKTFQVYGVGRAVSLLTVSVVLIVIILIIVKTVRLCDKQCKSEYNISVKTNCSRIILKVNFIY